MLLNMLLFFNFLFWKSPDKGNADIPKSIYDFKVDGLTGGTIDFADFKGKKIMIVNTASECGYTPQYEDLEALYKKYEGRLVIVGFPANDFGKQEPGTNDEISVFCKKNYGVTFPMAAKITVKGKEMAPVYQWLTDEKYNGYKSSEVKWNFQKYIIDENGKLITVFMSKIKPMDDEVIKAIEQ